MSTKLTKPKPIRGEAYGILNPFGDFWTHRTFEFRDQADAYLANWWSGVAADKRPDLTKFQIVDVKVTVSLSEAGRAALQDGKPSS